MSGSGRVPDANASGDRLRISFSSVPEPLEPREEDAAHRTDPDRPRHRANGGSGEDAPLTIIDAARREHAMYDRRIARLGRDLACDISWNMLVDLLIGETTGRSLSVMAVSIGSRASPATAIRYLALLESAGVVLRARDRSDRRRTFVRLTPNGRTIVQDLLRSR